MLRDIRRVLGVRRLRICTAHVVPVCLRSMLYVHAQRCSKSCNQSCYEGRPASYEKSSEGSICKVTEVGFNLMQSGLESTSCIAPASTYTAFSGFLNSCARCLPTSASTGCIARSTAMLATCGSLGAPSLLLCPHSAQGAALVGPDWSDPTSSPLLVRTTTVLPLCRGCLSRLTISRHVAVREALARTNADKHTVCWPPAALCSRLHAWT